MREEECLPLRIGVRTRWINMAQQSYSRGVNDCVLCDLRPGSPLSGP